MTVLSKFQAPKLPCWAKNLGFPRCFSLIRGQQHSTGGPAALKLPFMVGKISIIYGTK